MIALVAEWPFGLYLELMIPKQMESVAPASVRPHPLSSSQ